MLIWQIRGPRAAVVEVAKNSVGPVAHGGKSDAQPVARTGLEHPVETPLRLFDQAALQVRIRAAHPQLLSQTEHGVNGFGGVDGALRKVARIVPASVDDDSLVSVNSLPVAMAGAVHSWDLHSAALCIEEVQVF